MDEQEKTNVGEEPKEAENKQEPAQKDEPKADAKGTKKAKAEKPSVAQRAKSAVKRNKKPLIAGAVGFVTGAISTIGGAMWLGHRHRKAEEEAAAANVPVVLPEETYSPLDPNV